MFLLPSVAFDEQNVKVKLKTQKNGKTEKKTQWLAKIGSRLAARGSGSQARTLVTLTCHHLSHFSADVGGPYLNYASI